MSYLFTDEIGFKGNAVDAFNRLRVSNPFTIFDSQHRYQINDKWNYLTGTGGSTGYSENESTVSLIVGTTSGSKVSAETKRVFPYQPGKSLLVFSTSAFATPKSGLRQRLGYFGVSGGTPYNGVFLEQNGLTLSMVLQSASLNTTTTINQKDWNGDKLDGSGPSGITLDVTKGNILFMDFEWLGVGDVRTGFVHNGRPIVAHTFKNANQQSTTYMTTASLPLRLEIENTTNQASSATMKQICSSVMSEAGFQGFSRKYSVSVGTSTRDLGVGGSQNPIISIRLNPNRLDAIVIPSTFNVIVTSNTWVSYRLLLNPTFGGAGVTWTTHHNNNVDYVIHNTATTVSSGIDILGGYINNNGVANVSEASDFNFQLGRTQSGVSDILTLMVSSASNNTNILADLSWFEII